MQMFSLTKRIKSVVLSLLLCGVVVVNSKKLYSCRHGTVAKITGHTYTPSVLNVVFCLWFSADMLSNIFAYFCAIH